MRKTLYPAIVILALLSFVALGLTQEEKKTLTGYLVDKACSARLAKQSDPMAAAANHTRGCALMDNCATSGYGVFADGKFYEFDENGNKQAKELLGKSSKQKGVKVRVEGTVHQSHLMVANITEVE